VSPRRRRGRRAAAAGAGPLRGDQAARRLPRRIARVAITIVVVAAAAVFLGRWLAHAPLATRGSAPVNAVIATLNPGTVFRTADSLGRAGRHFASLPYYRQSLRNARAGFWQLHLNYGMALYNATLEIEAHNGLPVSPVRSSWERVACMREALREILTAEQLARGQRELALVKATRARMLWIWGLPWETLAACRDAQSADPADRALAQQADQQMELLRSPGGPARVDAQRPRP
jgi:hypothetical protein